MKDRLPDGKTGTEPRPSGKVGPVPGFNFAIRAARGEAGFTLVELVLVIVLLGIVSAVAAIPLMEGARIFTSGEVRADLNNQGRLAVERMAREIRMARSRTAADLPGCCNAGTFSFVNLNGIAIAYTTAAGNTITQNGTVLAAGDTVVLNFSYFQQNGVTPATLATQVWSIQIDLTVTRSGESQAYRVRVHPRNFV